MRAGKTLIKLVQIAEPPPARDTTFQAGVRWLTFIFEDLPATVRRLQQRGLQFLSEPVSAPDAKHVVCAEGPDGVLIELVQIE